MAQMRVVADDFNLVSGFRCFTSHKYYYTAAGTLVDSDVPYGYIAYAAETVTKKVRFAYNIPNGATVKSVKVCATLGSSMYGARVCTINDVHADEGSSHQREVSLVDGAGYVDVSFTFQSKSTYHDHTGSDEYIDSWVYDDPNNNNCNVLTRTWETKHEGSISYTKVYLLIEYDPALDFSGWTDDPLVVGETVVKGVHMTELQQWTAVLSEYADNGTPTFTEAVPGETSLALWLSQVQEIRAVLDVIDPDHETWIDVSVNCPRADVMTQLRNIIVAAM